MKLIAYTILSCLFLFLISRCTEKYYNPIVIRPASCSKELQFAESPDLSHLLAFADKMEKPVFLDFYAPWVPSCKKTDDFVFKQSELASYFNQYFINYKINAGGISPGPELTDMYRVTTFPTYIFLDGKGKIMLRHDGYASAGQLLEMGMYLHHADDETVSMGTR